MTEDSNLEIMIETEGLSKYYGNFIAVNDLNQNPQGKSLPFSVQTERAKARP